MGVAVPSLMDSLLEAPEVGKPGINWSQVSPEHRKKIEPIVKHYMGMAKPFTACVRDNRKRFGERAERVCAVVKDMGREDTHWRKGRVSEETIEDLAAMAREARERLDVVGASLGEPRILELAEVALYEREFTEGKRKNLAGKGKALPGGGYPIENESDLKNAIRAVGRAKDRSKTIAHIKKHARRLKKTHLLPDSWSGGALQEEAVAVRTAEETYITVAEAVLQDMEVLDLLGPRGKWTGVLERVRAAGHAGGGPPPRSMTVHYPADAILPVGPVLGEAKQDAQASLLSRVKGLKPGETVRAPDGLGIKHLMTEDGRPGYRVGEPRSYGQAGELSYMDGGFHRDPKDAVRAMMLRSARSTDPAAVGGKTRWDTYSPLVLDGSKTVKLDSVHLDGSPMVVPHGSYGPLRAEPEKTAWTRLSKPPNVRESDLVEAWPVFDPSKHPKASSGPAGGQFVRTGSTGPEVQTVQRKVGVKPDKQFGNKTEAAVRTYQKKNGLKVDGVVGHQTASAITGQKNAKKEKVGELTAKDRKALGGKKK